MKYLKKAVKPNQYAEFEGLTTVERERAVQASDDTSPRAARASSAIASVAIGQEP